MTIDQLEDTRLESTITSLIIYLALVFNFEILQIIDHDFQVMSLLKFVDFWHNQNLLGFLIDLEIENVLLSLIWSNQNLLIEIIEVDGILGDSLWVYLSKAWERLYQLWVLCKRKSLHLSFELLYFKSVNFIVVISLNFIQYSLFFNLFWFLKTWISILGRTFWFSFFLLIWLVKKLDSILLILKKVLRLVFKWRIHAFSTTNHLFEHVLAF